jgi:hypothetical protein
MVQTIIHTTDLEKDELLRKVLGKDYATAGNNLPVLKKLIDKIEKTDHFFSFVELVPIINRILSIRAFSIVASGASITSIFLFPVSAMIDIINAMEIGRKMYAYRGIAYATTSWAFNREMYKGSMKLLHQARTGIPRIQISDLVEYEKAWRNATNDSIKKIVETANSNNIPIDAMKLFFRVIADNDKQKLCAILLKGFEKQFDYSTAQVWKSNYRIKYPN